MASQPSRISGPHLPPPLSDSTESHSPEDLGLLVLLALGELTVEERRPLEAHLAGCPECASQQRGIEAVVSVLVLPERENPEMEFVTPWALSLFEAERHRGRGTGGRGGSTH